MQKHTHTHLHITHVTGKGLISLVNIECFRASFEVLAYVSLIRGAVALHFLIMKGQTCACEFIPPAEQNVLKRMRGLLVPARLR